MGTALRAPLTGHCMVTLGNGTVLIAGGNSYVGLSDHTRSVKKTWLLNPSTGELVNGTDMKSSKSDHACAVFEDKVYVVAKAFKDYDHKFPDAKDLFPLAV